MNAEKLSKLQSQVRIGGKGTARRKKKVVHRTATTDDKKLQSALKKLTVNAIPGIEQVDMYKDDDMVIHFVNPKVQASLAANTFAITGQGETRPLKDTPEAIPLMGSGSIEQLSKLFAQGLGGQGGVAGNSALNDMAAQLSAGGLGALDGAAAAAAALGSVKEEEDDEVPQLVQNFDEAAKIKEN